MKRTTLIKHNILARKRLVFLKRTTLIEHSVELTPPLIEHRGLHETVALERNNLIEHRF